jgi:hypothetical protein
MSIDNRMSDDNICRHIWMGSFTGRPQLRTCDRHYRGCRVDATVRPSHGATVSANARSSVRRRTAPALVRTIATTTADREAGYLWGGFGGNRPPGRCRVARRCGVLELGGPHLTRCAVKFPRRMMCRPEPTLGGPLALVAVASGEGRRSHSRDTVEGICADISGAVGWAGRGSVGCGTVGDGSWLLAGPASS